MVVVKKDFDPPLSPASITPENLNDLTSPSIIHNGQDFNLNPETSKTCNDTPENNENHSQNEVIESIAKFHNKNEYIGSNTTLNPKSNVECIIESNGEQLRNMAYCNGVMDQAQLSCELEDMNEQEMSIESNESSEIKIQPSDEEIEIGDIDSGLDLEQNKIDVFIDMFLSNDDNKVLNNQKNEIQQIIDEKDAEEESSSPKKQIINIKLADVKSNFSEFEGFMRFYLYINQLDEKNVELSLTNNSMDLFFTTSDETFNSVHNPNNHDNIIYKLSLNFCNEIVPENCYVKQIKKKSLEIHLEKTNKITWGGIGISPINTNETASIETYSPNKWTPCAIKKDEPIQIFNNLQLVKYEPPTDIENDDFTNTDKGRFYGYTGLDNLGNTCFMNSVLQCLSNTDPLRDYFLSKKYVEDINKSNPLGHGGVIVEAFAQFLKQMWMGKQSSIAPYRLKSLMGEKITSMFMGFNQHDAQEFMSFFLDAIHEDLNRNENKPKINYNCNDSDSDEKELYDESDFATEEKRKQLDNMLKDKANEMWKQYRLFNNSIVIDLFYGQFRSILTCPDCYKKSIMFDPFLYVPLPIPPPKIKYEVIFFSRDEATGMCTGSTSFLLKLPYSATACELMNVVSQSTNVPTKLMRLIQQQEDNMPPKFLNPNWLLTDYARSSFSDTCSNRNRTMLLFEIFKDENEEYIELCIIQRSRERRRFLKNHFSSNNDIRIGLPFIVSIRKSMLTYSHLCAVLCSYASHSVYAYRPTSAECFSSAIFSKTHSTRAFNTDLFSSEKRNFPFDINNITTPRLVYSKCSTLQENDIFVPFTLFIPNFKNICELAEEEEEEVTPPIINEMEENCSSEDSDISEESQSTIVNIANEDSESLTDEPFNELYKRMPQEENFDRICKATEYENEALLELENVFYIAMEWIDTQTPSEIAVKWSRVECKKRVDLTTTDDVSLDECLRLFNEPEVLGPQNCWRCPSCKDLREATKQLSFWRLPPILVIQLKRFKMRNVIYRDKINQLVKYPIRGLDLSKLQNGESGIESNGKKMKPIYDLYAVVNHMGDAFMGHYTAFARSFDEKLGWRHFDDSSVENIDESNLVTSNAYLLFYKCRSSDEEGEEHSSNIITNPR